MIQPIFSVEIGNIILGSVIILCGLGLFVAVRGITAVIRENASIRLDAAALVTGDLMPLEKKERISRINKRVSGLRLKLVSFTIALVLAVDLMASVPLYIIMTRSQRQTLIKGLLDRATVLLDGLAANAKVFLSQGNIEGVSFLPAQMASIPEALYVTITGYNQETLVFGDQVWATNDPNILQKIDSQTIRPGFSRLTDAISPRLNSLVPELNSQAGERVGGTPKNIVSLRQEASILAESAEAGNNIDKFLRLEEIQTTIHVLDNRISETLYRITEGIKSEPEYSLENLFISPNHRYLFYKPIMYAYGSEDEFFWGVVRLEVSINPILSEIDAQQRSLMSVNLLVALAAQTIGAIGAFILSSLIIRPVKQLVKHVERIRDTEDKTMLSGVDIKLKTHDELASLGETINEMTHGLVHAALAASDLSTGKEIQKKFLPLEFDNEGNKLSSGFEETTYLNIFGYYEGAKGVSGDYFDYQDLDGRFYAIIKCDVAGKGIPAAFIMIQVATMFLNYCKHWKATDRGMHIEEVVYQINEFIENLSFRGRFAAFTLCLYDSYTGNARFCNAGDNIIHIYDASEKRIKNLFLPEMPAAGVLPNPEVESKGGYTVQTIKLDRGDILLLYTDGIEESIRKFRNAEFEEIVCTNGPDDSIHENHVAGQTVEELGFDRVQSIVNSVMNKQIYTLHKWHNGEGEGKELQFDFRSSGGSVEDVIMALISVEKMFRCYYNPKAAVENRVLVDRIVDAFLKKYFLQYREYCSFTEESLGNPAYMYYLNIMEDEQSDDLTILGLKRK
jgi:serine phosphatase RsbU (regulator of sigma subunit)